MGLCTRRATDMARTGARQPSDATPRATPTARDLKEKSND